MCSVSMIMDSKTEDWMYRYWPNTPVTQPPITVAPFPTSQEIEEFRRLLDRARKWDRDHGQPDCELEEKREKLRVMAKELNVEISFV